MLEKKYDKNNFYVGELYLSSKLEGLTYKPNEDAINLLKNGAIRISKENQNNYIDLQKGLGYDSYFTLFYKLGFNYICLHNGKIYKVLGDDFCVNLVKFEKLFPKFANKLEDKRSLTVSKALDIFNILYNKQALKMKLYNKTSCDSSSLFLGDLNLCYRQNYNIKKDFFDNYQDLAFKYLLEDSLLKGYKDIKEDNKYANYFVYKNLFFQDDKNDKIISLNTNQSYDNNNELGNSYYSNLTPLAKYLETKQKPIVRKLTIPKALDLLKEK